MNLIAIRKLLGSKPLTKSIAQALSEGVEVDRIHLAAAGLNYSRSAVNHALRANGVRQRKERKNGPQKGDRLLGT